jgi:hypothetical protein
MGFIRMEDNNWMFVGSKELYDEIQKVIEEVVELEYIAGEFEDSAVG